MKDGFENFSMYGFAIDYPDESRVEFNSKNRREAGDIVFRLRDDARIYLSWGELEKVSKRFSSPEEHANYSLGAMEKGKNVRNFERVSRDTLRLHDHMGSVSKVKFDESLGLLGRNKTLPREAYSLHVHCDKSKRYFVLYTMTPASDHARFDKILELMRESFTCH